MGSQRSPQAHGAHETPGILASTRASQAASALAILQDSALNVGTPLAQPIQLAARMRLAGMVNLPHIEETCAALDPEDNLMFVRDTDYRDDPWAIRVLSPNGAHMGYVPADVNETFARLMDAGKRIYARFVETAWQNSWAQVYCDVYLDN